MSDININTYISYIKQYINDLSLSDKKDVLQLIMNSNIEDNKIQTKGDGTQIKFKDIPVNIIISIYNYMHNKINTKLNELEYFPDKEYI